MTEYTYHCDKCLDTKIIKKPMSEHARPEFCSICSSELRRDYSTSYSSMTVLCDHNWSEVKWKHKPVAQQHL